jgi:hypothetical protein
MQLDHLEDLPFLHFEVFTASARKVSFVEFVEVGVFEVTREVACRVGEFIGTIADQQVIASPEGRSVGLEAADGLVFERLHERVLGLVSDRKDESFPLEVGLEMCGISMEMVVPTERSEPSDDLVVFGEADGEGVLNAIAHLMELLDAESVVAGPVD